MSHLPIRIVLRGSQFLCFALCAAHAAAAISVWLVPGILPLRLAGMLFIAASLLVTVRRARRPFLASLCLQADGHAVGRLADGREVGARVLPDTSVFFWLVVLRLELEDEKTSPSLRRFGRRIVAQPILPDQLTRDEFRMLRVWLQWAVKAERDATPTSF